MNQKIKELVDHIGTDCSGKWISIDNVEKLSELIVRECAKHAEHAKGIDVDYQKYFKEFLFGVSE